MSRKRVLETQALGRRIAQGYVVAAVFLLIVLALRGPTVEAWFWRSVASFLPFTVSFRSALVYTYRRHPSALRWWLRPTAGEKEFTFMWLIYAVVFGAGSLAFIFI
ncbi:MAG: hypothetical protein IT179_09460 [Acidobacteria bacterium]|nr:hypothetical protein [Acidobacteriota bacterium]